MPHVRMSTHTFIRVILTRSLFDLGCGHCKNIKPELIQASIDLHEQQVCEEYFIAIYMQSLM